MIRLTWIGAVVAILSCSTASWGQSLQVGQIVTIREANKPPITCRVEKCWKEKDGSQRCQVKDLATGEILTLLQENGPVVPTTGSSTIKGPNTSALVPTPTPALKPVPTQTEATKAATKPSDCAPCVSSSTTPIRPCPCVSVVEKPQRTGWRLFGITRTNQSASCSDCSASTSVTVTTVESPTFLEKLFSGKSRDSKPVVASSSPTVKEEIVSPSEGKVTEMLGQLSMRQWLFSNRKPQDQTVVVESSNPQQPKTQRSRLLLAKPDSTETVVSTNTEREEVFPKKAPAEGRRTLADLLPARPAKREVVKEKPASPEAKPRQLPLGMGSVAASAMVFVDPYTGRPIPIPSIPVGTGNAFSREVPASALVMRPPQTMLPPVPPGPQPVPPGMVGYYPSGTPLPPSLAGTYVPQVPGPQMAMVAVPIVPMPLPGRAFVQNQEPTSTQLVQTLKDALLPSDRELAVEQLARIDWKTDANVVPALIQAASKDPAPMVRARCVQALGQMKVNSVPVLQTIQSLKTDPDLRVRQQAEQTLKILLAP